MAEHPYTREHSELGHPFHGGFLGDEYIPPRSLGRAPAIRAWRRQLVERGHRLVDCARGLHHYPALPNLEQHKLLLQHGVDQILWNDLTVTAVNEGKGGSLSYVPDVSLQDWIEEDLSDTATGHLWKGLFWAHGLDEAGHRDSPKGGHKQMWTLIRDGLIDRDFGRPKVETLHTRPRAPREMPALPEPIEKLFHTCMALLQIEIRSLDFADICQSLFDDPELFRDRRDIAEASSRLVERIRRDEQVHIDYLQVAVSEWRTFTFKTERGAVSGKQVIDPVWEDLLRWPTAEADGRRCERARSASAVTAEAALGESAKQLMVRYDELR